MAHRFTSTLAASWPLITLVVIGLIVHLTPTHPRQLRTAAAQRWAAKQSTLNTNDPQAVALAENFHRCLKANRDEMLYRVNNNYEHASGTPFWRPYSPAEVQLLLDDAEVACTTSLLKTEGNIQSPGTKALAVLMHRHHYRMAMAYQALISDTPPVASSPASLVP